MLKKKWLTCTPKRFIGTKRFFARDSGLLSEGFKIAGVESQAIMLGPAMDDDDPRILRAEASSLENVNFWKSFNSEGVVLYAWGMPKYTPIAKAIKDAGLKLVINLDSSGMMCLRNDGFDGIKLNVQRHIKDSGLFLGMGKAALSYGKNIIPQLVELPRLEHLSCGDVIGAVSPIACDRIKKYALCYRRKDIAEKVKVIMHPIALHMRYSGEQKLKRLIAVGRWKKEDWVKNQPLLVSSLSLVLDEYQDYECVIVGSYDAYFKGLIRDLPESVQKRIQLVGVIPNDEMVSLITSSQISVCTSISESFHIASAEALCCGCSVVAHYSPYLPAFDYFVSTRSGTLSISNDPKDFAEVIHQEIGFWERGERNPVEIARYWSDELHADNVARRILDLVEGLA